MALVIGPAALLAGCAGGALAPSRSVAGQSGSIAREVPDVARNAAQDGWDYDVVLTEQAGVPFRFQRQEVALFVGDSETRPLAGTPFSRSLDRHDKVHLRLWSAGSEAGDVRLLDPSAQAAARTPPRGSSRPAAERVAELEALPQQKLISEAEYQAARTRILQGL